MLCFSTDYTLIFREVWRSGIIYHSYFDNPAAIFIVGP